MNRCNVTVADAFLRGYLGPVLTEAPLLPLAKSTSIKLVLN
jgi:hypothetical protein